MSRRKDNEKRKRILDSAIKVFAKTGYSDARIQDVAEEAGVSHGTVYIYFKNKDALFMSIFQEILGELIQYISSEIQKEKNAEDKIRRIISMQLDIIEENPDLTKLILIEFPRSGNFLNDSNTNVLSRYIDLISDVLKQGIDEGIFSIEMRTEVTATMIYAGIQGIATRWILDGMGYSLKAMEKSIADILLNGLKSFVKA
ncbi:TPA: TetR/AcrR family transcriptional regulator [Candidatus Poribacteria bacterium]|nr:TetR/AcrR family transcriptional regulator [Candidatus Poribacteria bacterium]